MSKEDINYLIDTGLNSVEGDSTFQLYKDMWHWIGWIPIHLVWKCCDGPCDQLNTMSLSFVGQLHQKSWLIIFLQKIISLFISVKLDLDISIFYKIDLNISILCKLVPCITFQFSLNKILNQFSFYFILGVLLSIILFLQISQGINL